ncbi:MAG: hypothetical protein NVS1B9_04590 [Solirubrobacteraceae bacterium]
MKLAFLILAAVGAAPAAAAGGPAAAPVLKTEHACYLPQQPVRLAGSGFTAGARYAVVLDRKIVGGGSVGPGGRVAGTLSSGILAAGIRQARRRVSVRDGKLSARAAFDVSAFGAGFTPAVGDPRTLKVRFSVFGLGVAAPPRAPIFLHYLDPRGHLLRTTPLGSARDTCGNLASSAQLSLFPFKTVRTGSWRLQFDLRPAYSPGARPRITRLVAVR